MDEAKKLAAAEAKDRMMAKHADAVAKIPPGEEGEFYPWIIGRNQGNEYAYSIGETEEDAWIDAMTAPSFGFESAEEFIEHCAKMRSA